MTYNAASIVAAIIGRSGSVEEMRAPALVDDHGEALESSYGLGLQVAQLDGQRLTGHYGAMPGFVAAM